LGAIRSSVGATAAWPRPHSLRMGAGRRAERLGRFPRPGPRSRYADKRARARGRDKCGLFGVPTTLKRPRPRGAGGEDRRSNPSAAEHGRGHLNQMPRWGLLLRAALPYARPAVRSQPTTEGRSRMAGFLFKLETVDGAPAELSSLSSAVPTWGPGETIHVGRRTLRVVAVRDDDARARGVGEGPPRTATRAR
jgi:hypothetical protein